ncbi:MAG: hypothetical protein ACK5Q7_10300 [Cyanobacteriota bacterium]
MGQPHRVGGPSLHRLLHGSESPCGTALFGVLDRERAVFGGALRPVSSASEGAAPGHQPRLLRGHRGRGVCAPYWPTPRERQVAWAASTTGPRPVSVGMEARSIWRQAARAIGAGAQRRSVPS